MTEYFDGFAVFSCEPHGFDKEQVGRYLAMRQQQYKKVFDENIRLRKKVKALKDKLNEKDNAVSQNQTGN